MIGDAAAVTAGIGATAAMIGRVAAAAKAAAAMATGRNMATATAATAVAAVILGQGG